MSEMHTKPEYVDCTCTYVLTSQRWTVAQVHVSSASAVVVLGSDEDR